MQLRAQRAIPAFIACCSAAAGAPPTSRPAEGDGLRMYAVLAQHDATPHLRDWLARQGWVWGVEVRPSAASESVRALRERGYPIVLDFYGHAEARAARAELRGTPAPRVEDVLPRLREAAGTDFIWQILFEDDSAGTGFSQRLLRARPGTHADARKMFDAWLDEAVAPAAAFPGVPLWGVCGHASAAHAFAARLDCTLVERCNDDVEDLQTAVAFARGAAAQFDKDWGIDLSLWWGPVNGCVYDLPASLFRRHLYLSYFAGCRTFRVEGVDLLPRGAGEPETQVVQELRQFHRTVRDLRPGRPDVPIAVILPGDHGWITPPYWRTTSEAWGHARIPYRPGDRGIDGFFGAAFPGSVYAMDPFPFGAYASDDPPASPFSLACVTTRFAPSPEDVYFAPPPLPFGRFADRLQAGNHFATRRADPAPYRPMSDSRWGDIFDVLTTSARETVLTRYAAVVLLGPVPHDAALFASLRAYVEQGGTLVAAAGVVGPADRDLIGVDIVPEQRVGRAWQWRGEAIVHEAFRYVPATRSDAAQPLATGPGGEPLVVRSRVGKGSVYTCLVPWYEAGHTPLAHLAVRMFDELFGDVQPVLVQGLPCEWLSTRGPAGRYVVLANHAETPWDGTVAVREVEPGAECVEVRSGRAVPLTRPAKGATLAARVDPYDVAVFRFTPSKR